jgi:hypothetical protein
VKIKEIGTEREKRRWRRRRKRVWDSANRGHRVFGVGGNSFETFHKCRPTMRMVQRLRNYSGKRIVSSNKRRYFLSSNEN